MRSTGFEYGFAHLTVDYVVEYLATVVLLQHRRLLKGGEEHLHLQTLKLIFSCSCAYPHMNGTLNTAEYLKISSVV